ncbi:MAG: ParB/RepB/Spo0J family partition protein [Candidatus Dormibacteria bacterium]
MTQTHMPPQRNGEFQLGRHKVGLIALADISSHLPTRGSVASLAHLAQSMERYGLLTPLLVENGPSGGYQLVAGTRRLAASSVAGMTRVPCVILDDLTDLDRSAICLLDNVLRETLAGRDSAAAYDRLLRQAGSPKRAGALAGVHQKSIPRAVRRGRDPAIPGRTAVRQVQDALEAMSDITARLAKLSATDRHDLVDAARRLISVADQCTR